MQYIPGNGDQTISGIKPFNEFYFLNCFYSALFPVMIARGSNVINFLVNSPLIYSWEGCTEQRFLSADCCHVQELEAVLLNEGIDVEAYGITNRFTYDLTKALCRGRAVIVNVDCFYEPIRQDCYQTMHWHHSLLAYGLNSETGMVQILEQSRSDVLDYRETSIALEDLSCMYEGIFSISISRTSCRSIVLGQRLRPGRLRISQQPECNMCEVFRLQGQRFQKVSPVCAGSSTAIRRIAGTRRGFMIHPGSCSRA